MPPITSLSENPFLTRGFVDEAGLPFQLSPVSGAAAERLSRLARTGGVDRDGTSYLALDERHGLVGMPGPVGAGPQDYLLVENRGSADAPQFVAASVRLIAPGVYRRNDDSWQIDFGVVSRATAHAGRRLWSAFS